MSGLKYIAFALITPALQIDGAIADEPRLPKWVTDAGLQWQPPPEGVVRDGKAAITIATLCGYRTFRQMPIGSAMKRLGRRT